MPRKPTTPKKLPPPPPPTPPPPPPPVDLTPTERRYAKDGYDVKPGDDLLLRRLDNLYELLDTPEAPVDEEAETAYALEQMNALAEMTAGWRELEEQERIARREARLAAAKAADSQNGSTHQPQNADSRRLDVASAVSEPSVASRDGHHKTRKSVKSK